MRDYFPAVQPLNWARRWQVWPPRQLTPPARPPIWAPRQVAMPVRQMAMPPLPPGWWFRSPACSWIPLACPFSSSFENQRTGASREAASPGFGLHVPAVQGGLRPPLASAVDLPPRQREDLRSDAGRRLLDSARRSTGHRTSPARKRLESKNTTRVGVASLWGDRCGHPPIPHRLSPTGYSAVRVRSSPPRAWVLRVA
jgi:hypothetical protein